MHFKHFSMNLVAKRKNNLQEKLCLLVNRCKAYKGMRKIWSLKDRRNMNGLIESRKAENDWQNSAWLVENKTSFAFNSFPLWRLIILYLQAWEIIFIFKPNWKIELNNNTDLKRRQCSAFWGQHGDTWFELQNPSGTVDGPCCQEQLAGFNVLCSKYGQIIINDNAAWFFDDKSLAHLSKATCKFVTSYNWELLAPMTYPWDLVATDSHFITSIEHAL